MFKKMFLLGIVLSIFSQMSFCQESTGKLEKIASFTGDGDEYLILSDYDVTKSYIYVTLRPRSDGDYVMSRFKKSKLKGFLRSLELAKEKYKEWQLQAKISSVKQFSMRMQGVYFHDQYVFFTDNGKWYHEKGLNVWAKFYVDENANCFLIIETDYMSADEVVSTNISTGWGYSMAFGGGWRASHGKTEVLRSAGGATITFASVAEIDQCISQLQKALDMKDQNKKNSRMFY